MPDNFAVAHTTIPQDIPNGGTFDVYYPAGTATADYEGGDPAQVVLILDNSDRYQGPDYVTAAYGDTVTVTNTGQTVWRAGQDAMVQFPKKPLYADAADAVDQISAVLGAGAALAPLDPAADLPTTVGKVNEIIAVFKTNGSGSVRHAKAKAKGRG